MASGAILIAEGVRIPAHVFNLEGFRRWAHSEKFPERGRFSYLGGEIEVDMSPEEIQTHNKLKSDLTVDLGNWIRAQKLGDLLADRALLVNVEADLATEPDITFCSWKSLRSGRVRYAERVQGSERYVEVLGAPDLVIEIVSDHSVHKDTKVLPKRYFRAGVPEYWLIDARGDRIDFRILTAGKKGYVAASADRAGYQRSPVLGGSFRLLRRRNPVGGFVYSLIHR